MGNDESSEKDSSIAEYMNLVGQRADFLEYLCEEPAEKRDLIDNLGVSRSTVDRALSDLQDAGLVRYGDGAYETTATGVIAVKQYRTHIDQSADIHAAHEALRPLPPDTRLDPAMVVGASVTLTEEPRPYQALRPLASSLRDATRIRALLPNVPDSRHVELYHDRVRSGADVQMVLSPKLSSTLSKQFSSTCKRMAGYDEYRAHEGTVPPFGVILTEDDGVTAVSVVVYTENGSVHSVIHTGTLDAVQWAEGLYEDVVAEATDVTASLRDLDTAEEYFEKARAVREESDHTRRMYQDIHSLGIVHLERDDYDTARTLLSEALEKFREYEKPRREATALRRLGEVAMETDELEEAKRHTEAAVEQAREANAQDFVLDGLEQLATIHERLGNVEQAIKCCKEAVSLTEQMELDERRETLVEKCNRFESAVAAG